MTLKKIDYSNTIIYKIVCNDLSVTDCYVGNTTQFRQRKSQHKRNCSNSNSKDYNFPLYKFIREHDGWENFSMIEIEKYPCNDGNEARSRERYYFDLLNASLNKNRPLLSKEDTKIDNKILRQTEKYKEMKKLSDKNYMNNHKEKIKEYRKKYDKENKEKIKDNHKLYYEENKIKILERVKAYSEVNKDKILKKQKEYYGENKDKIKEYNEKYHEENKEKQKAKYEENKDIILTKRKEKITCSCNAIISRGYMSRHLKSFIHISKSQSLFKPTDEIIHA